jgi:uncharacterized membrane protein YfcA
MMPFAVLGVMGACYFMGNLPTYLVELIIGGLALTFLAQKFLLRPTESKPLIKGYVLSMLSGFSSTIAQAGGPPASMYLLPKQLPKKELIGTSVVFFAALNFIKVIAYGYMGQFDTQNLATSLVLVPVAFLGVRTGVWLVDIISQTLIYKISYSVLFLTGIKMLYSGFAAL